MTPAEWITGLLAATGSVKHGRLWQCPAHPDPTPSLSVRQHTDGASIHCFGGCPSRKVLAALHLSRAQLRHPPMASPEQYATRHQLRPNYPPVEIPRGEAKTRANGWHLDAIHPYGDHRILRWRHRSGRKDLQWESRRDGVWIPGLLGTPTADLPPYNQVDVAGAIAMGEQVYLVESESSADAFSRQGMVATTWAGGAGAPHAPVVMRRILTGATVVAIPDNDDPGRECWRRIHTALDGSAATITVVWPDPGQDARDLLAADPDRIP